MRRKIRKKILVESFEYGRSLSSENETEIEMSTATKTIIDHWYNMPNLIKSKFNTKAFERAIMFLNNRKILSDVKSTHFYSIEKYLSAIQTYNNILPSGNVKKVNIADFFIPPDRRYSKQPTYYQLITSGKMEEHIKIDGTIKQRKYVASRIQWHYCKHVLGADPNKHSISQKQGRDFAIAARKLLRYMYKNNKLDIIDYEEGAKLDDFIRTLIAAIRWNYRMKFFHIGCLCSEHTFTEVLPKYVHLQIRKGKK